MGIFDDPVWQALAAMRIEPEGASLSFTRRLARENGWSRTHAEAVMEEYRRFLYLAATGTDTVTPSDQIDQAWHLHLAYTRHYWEELCARIIGRPLHHGPTAGGSAEGRKYRSLYAATLQRYRDTFGSEPPSDIWPPSDVRFGVRYQWVDRSRHFVLPRRHVSIAGMAGGAVLLAACTALAADTASAQSAPVFKQFWNTVFATSTGFVLFIVGLGLAFFLLGLMIDRRRQRRRASHSAGQTRAERLRRKRDTDSSGGGDSAFDGWSGGGAGGTAAAGGAAFAAGGGDFGGGGAEGDWSDSGGSSDSGGDSGCSSGCGGGCGGGD
ncbi:glycine-rich domain-containing protein [Sphingomonas sp. 35-24ZXX]|uniref:glycine-rich domain-containing protein n=1 Tax=Sphingomonas sp. 35-24ZXX TaxID=1545915 RepID=UPI000A765A7A|nr:hypothetical protein [Sphingomonas sp. 35-24ZXX]